MRIKGHDLICINICGEKHYFTSATKAGMYLGVQYNSIIWAIEHKNKVITKDDRVCTITIVDGSEIPYKYINNF